MKVQFITNVGTRDAKAFGIEAEKCTGGSVHDFPDELARRLIEWRDKETPPLAREFTSEMAAAQRLAEAAPARPETFGKHPHESEEKPKK